MTAVSAQVVSCRVYDNPLKIIQRCNVPTLVWLLGKSVCSSPSTSKELHGIDAVNQGNWSLSSHIVQKWTICSVRSSARLATPTTLTRGPSPLAPATPRPSERPTSFWIVLAVAAQSSRPKKSFRGHRGQMTLDDIYCILPSLILPLSPWIKGKTN